MYRFLIGTAAMGCASMVIVMCVHACHQHHATRTECQIILDRIVQIELHEQGFRDPALLERKQHALSERFARDLDACVGRNLPDGAMLCVHHARSTEEISHTCLR